MGRERLLVAALALIASCAFFYEYLPPFKQVHLWSDIEGYHYPLQRFAFQALKEGRIAQWDSSIYCGISFAGNVQAALFYPPTWLMYAAAWTLPKLPFKALEVFTFVHVWLAFLLCYVWLRGRTGKLASAFGAAVFAFTGHMVYQLGHPGTIGAMTWIPLGLWGIDEAVDRCDWRPLWKVAAASALSFLAGYPAAWIASCVIIVVYALGSRSHARAAMGVCLAIVASVLLFMVQLLPTMEAESLMVLERKYRPGAYGPGTLLLSYLVPNWFDFNSGHPTYFDPGSMYLYLGLPALFAMAWAIRRHQGRAYFQPVLGLAVALLLADPPHFLIRAVERVPALDYTMQPYSFYAAVAAMAALITATGLNDFLEARSPGTIPAWAFFGSATALAAWSFRELWIWHRGGLFATGTRAAVETAIALVLFSVCLWCVRQTTGRRRNLITALLVLTVATDYKVFGSGRWFNAIRGDVDDLQLPYGIAGVDDAAYRAMWENRQYRVVTDEDAGPDPVDYRYWGLATPAGFDPFLPAEYQKTIERWVPFRTNRLFYADLENEAMLQALGVRYVLVRSGFPGEPLLAASRNYRLVGTTEIFCRVYEYLHAKPPYHWEHEDGGRAEPAVWIPERREFLVGSERGGRFVLVEQFFPGWKAFLDGHPAGIERWDGAFQAVQVPPGEHRVAFEFRPMSLRIGAAISLLAATALLWLVAASRPREI
ncbi:MAG: YfhO family protein [Acidobacteriia bacterium]|nr:YfhO family protein [Terriglobia bacterium]